MIFFSADLDLQSYEPTFVEELDLLCKYGWNLNKRLPLYDNQTALSFSISRNAPIDTVKRLVRHGARFDIPDNHGQTVLHLLSQTNVIDPVFNYLIDVAPSDCLNVRNQSGGTALDLLYLSTYEKCTWSQLQRLHLLLSRRESRLTRYGMREPNLLVKKQYKLFDIIAAKEFLFKYRLSETFDCSVRPMSWWIFFFYDVLKACEQSNMSQTKVQQRLDRYLVSLIENGEIPLSKLVFRSGSRLEQSMLSSSRLMTNENENRSQRETNRIQNRLIDLAMNKLTLKALCRIQIKNQIRSYPNDVLKLDGLSKVLQAYLTFFNPFVKVEPAIVSI